MKYLMKSKFFTESKKYIKTYETIDSPQIGDYVYCETISDYTPNKFIGIITEISNLKYPYTVKTDLERDPKRLVLYNEIICFAKTIKELDPCIEATIYNL